MNTPTLEFKLSFHVPGSDVAAMALGTAVAAAVEKTLSEHGCAMTLNFVCPSSVAWSKNGLVKLPGDGVSVETRPDTPETRAEDAAAEQQEAAEAAAEPPTPEPEKPKRTRKVAEPKTETPPAQEQPAPEPEKAPEAPAADLMDGSICSETLLTLHRTGGAEAAAAKIPGGWAVIPGLIQARGYSGLAAVKAALKVSETAAQATADVNAILAEARASYAGLEQAIAAKREAEASELD